MELLLEAPFLVPLPEVNKLIFLFTFLFTFSLFLGTRIIYERAFLMKMRNSPLAKTPPANLPVIPGVTVPKEHNARKSPEKEHQHNGNEMPQKLQTVTGTFGHSITQPRVSIFEFSESAKEDEDDEQFDMDI